MEAREIGKMAEQLAFPFSNNTKVNSFFFLFHPKMPILLANVTTPV